MKPQLYVTRETQASDDCGYEDAVWILRNNKQHSIADEIKWRVEIMFEEKLGDCIDLVY